jgi:hypothetical protein
MARITQYMTNQFIVINKQKLMFENWLDKEHNLSPHIDRENRRYSQTYIYIKSKS